MIDLSISSGHLATDDSLETAIRISLLTDARARPDDDIRGDDLRGWWADQYLDRPNDSMGSRLWTLRGQRIDRAMELVESIVVEALQWMIDDGYVSSVEVTDIERDAPDRISFAATVERATGRKSFGPYEVSI